MQIVTLNEDLYQPFRDCRLAALQDTPEAFASSYDREALITEEEWKAKARQWSNGTTSTALLVMDKESAMGLASCYRDPEDPAQCILGGMWVHPDLRGTSLTVELVSNLAQWAAERGFRAMTAWVTDVNDRARRFYEKVGFILQTEERVHTNNPDLRDLLMIKLL